MEREHINELANLLRKSDLTWQEVEKIDPVMSQDEFEELKRTLIDRQISELERMKRGETLSAKQINEAVKKACKE